MDISQKKRISDVIYKFAAIADITDQELIEKEIDKIAINDKDGVIDSIIFLLYAFSCKGLIKKEDIYSNEDLLVNLYPEKYKTADDFFARLNFLLSMNLEGAKTSLSLNHQLVMETFNKFNELLAGSFDAYYTGGLMGYIATDHQLERYHSDLDLFINEAELLKLKELIDNSDNFSLISNMAHKEKNSHEYKITYNSTPMSIGLFLFSRNSDGSINTNQYHYEKEELCVESIHYSKKSTDLCFPNNIKTYNGNLFRMMSLESIYNSKKNSRPKDKYDAMVIKDNVDLLIDYEIDRERKNQTKSFTRGIQNSTIDIIESTIKSPANNKSKI